MKQNVLLLLIGVLVLSVSCTNKKSNKSTEPEVQVKQTTQTVADEAPGIIPKLQKVSDVAAVLELWDVNYHPDLVNEPLNAHNYVGNNQKMAANLGVYMGDMAYVTATKGYKESYKNFGAVMELAKGAGLEEMFPAMLIERYESDQFSTDSVITMLDAAFDTSEKVLSEKDRAEFYSFMLYGNYVEKLYLISSQIKKSAKSDLPADVTISLNRKLINFMGQQREPLVKLAKMMESYSSEVIHKEELDALIETYNKLETSRESLRQLKPEELYEAEIVKTLQSQIEQIRNRIIS